MLLRAEAPIIDGFSWASNVGNIHCGNQNAQNWAVKQLESMTPKCSFRRKCDSILSVGALVKFLPQTFDSVRCPDTLLRAALDRARIPNREFQVRSLKKYQGKEEPYFLCYFEMSEELNQEIKKKGNLLRVALQLLEVRYPSKKSAAKGAQGDPEASGGAGAVGQSEKAPQNQAHSSK